MSQCSKRWIYAADDDYLTVQGKDAVTSIQQLAGTETVGLVCGKYRLKSKPVMTVNGDLLGTVEDVYLSPNWEKLVATDS